MKFSEALAIALAATVALVSLAMGVAHATSADGAPPFLVPGDPYASEKITVSTSAIGITNTLCRVGGVATGPETPAIVQITTNGIFFTIHSSTNWPLATVGAYKAATDVWIPVPVPSKLRMVRQTNNADAIVTCVSR